MNVPHAFSLSLTISFSLSLSHKHTYVCIYVYIYIYILLAAINKSPIAASSNRGGEMSQKTTANVTTFAAR